MSREPRTPPWMPPQAVSTGTSTSAFPQGVVTKADIVAIKSLFEGLANEDQQKRAMACILRLTTVDDLSFRSDADGGARDTAFAEGKRFVGLQIRKFVLYPPDMMENI